MSTEKCENAPQEERPVEEIQEETPAPETAVPEEAPAELTEEEKLRADLETAKTELAGEKDKYLRVLAEYDNFRKRSSRERDNIYADVKADTIAKLLPVFDNIERAVDYASDENSKSGLQIIINNFRDTLSKMGVEQFGQRGDEFNADLHSAVMHVEDESLGENTVAEVFLKGYKKGDKIIRYATVKVAN